MKISEILKELEKSTKDIKVEHIKVRQMKEEVNGKKIKRRR